jgi:hypothetical protein
VQKTAHTDVSRAIIKNEYISQQIGYIQWAGFKTHSRDINCVINFFSSAIVPTLLFHNTDLRFTIENLMECSSCAEFSIITRQSLNFLVVQQTGVQGSLDTVMADLFGRTVEKKVCPKCSDEGLHYNSLSIIHCPKHMFVRCEPTSTLDQKVFELTPHIDISKIISSTISFTSSYSRYTLQSFITFYEKNEARRYFTYARHKDDWYCINNMDVKLVTSSSIFQDETKCRPIVLAHYVRPSETDVFSMALFNVFTNFSPQKPTLPPTLSLNDASNYFAKNNIFNHNPLNLIIVKRFDCSKCRKGTINQFEAFLLEAIK